MPHNCTKFESQPVYEIGRIEPVYYNMYCKCGKNEQLPPITRSMMLRYGKKLLIDDGKHHAKIGVEF